MPGEGTKVHFLHLDLDSQHLVTSLSEGSKQHHETTSSCRCSELLLDSSSQSEGQMKLTTWMKDWRRSIGFTSHVSLKKTKLKPVRKKDNKELNFPFFDVHPPHIKTVMVFSQKQNHVHSLSLSPIYQDTQ